MRMRNPGWGLYQLASARERERERDEETAQRETKRQRRERETKRQRRQDSAERDEETALGLVKLCLTFPLSFYSFIPKFLPIILLICTGLLFSIMLVKKNQYNTIIHHIIHQ